MAKIRLVTPRPSSPRLWSALLAAGLGLLLTVQAAVAVPEERRLVDAADMVALDYAALPDTVSPLSADYIAQVLGRAPADPASPASAQPPGPNTASISPTAAARQGSTSRVAAAPSAPVGPTNDDIARAETVQTLPFRHTVPAQGATRETDDPGTCLPAGGTWWYRWTPEADTLAVLTTTPSLVAPTTVGIFTGADPDPLRRVDCQTGVMGTRTPFQAAAGQTYWVQLTVPVGLGDIDVALVALGPITQLVAPAAGAFQPDETHCRICTVTDPGFIHLTASYDGRTVVGITNEALDPRDTNNALDVYAIDVTNPGAAPTLVSVSHDGRRAAAHPSGARVPAISADGRYVVFASGAADLVESDTNDDVDTFVHDLHTGITERVSLWSDGRQGEAPTDIGRTLDDTDVRPIQAFWVDISADGRYVVFETALTLDERDTTRTTHLHPDTVGEPAIPMLQGDAYLHDRRTGETRMLGLDEHGERPHDWYNSWRPAISGDGSTVVFWSDAELTSEDTDGVHGDYYMLDISTNRLTLVSPSRHGEDHHGHQILWGLSHDGRWLTFTSASDSLVPGDTNDIVDVFRVDTRTREISRVTVSSDGLQQTRPEDADCRPGPVTVNLPMAVIGSVPGACDVQSSADMSADGRYVVFSTNGVGLAPDDLPRPPGGALQSSRQIFDRDVFVHDAVTGITTWVSTTADGSAPREGSPFTAISGDGRTVYLSSMAALDGDGSPHPNPDAIGSSYRGPGVGLYVREIPTGV